VNRAADLGVVFVLSLALSCWIAWRWLLASGGDDRDAFSPRSGRDLFTVAVIVVVTIGGGVGYIGFKFAARCF
jgi:hypothetical protein